MSLKQIRRIFKRMERFKQAVGENRFTMAQIQASLEGWLAYAAFANTYLLSKRVINIFLT